MSREYLPAMSRFQKCRLQKPSALALIPFLAMGLLTGCPKKTGSTKTVLQRPQEDPLASVHETIRRDRTIDGFKTLVAQLNQYLGQATEGKPSPLSASERDVLVKQFKLSAEEIKEVERDEFTQLDTHYLDECFLFHDGVRALKLDFATKSADAALERARLAFAWAMRQVWLRDQSGRPLPPGRVLQLGFGAIPERAGVALAVFQQLGLDAGLIGRAEGQTPRPWAVGVRISSEVYLPIP